MKTLLVVLLLTLSSGTLSGQWLPGGISLDDSLDANSTLYPTLVADGHGGAYVGWEDKTRRPAHVYVQRVSRDGRFLWGPYGMQLSVPDTLRKSDQTCLQLLRCDDRFVYAAWLDGSYVRVQKLDTAGRRYWNPEGVIINPLRSGWRPFMASDSNSGFFVASVDMSIVDTVSWKIINKPWIQRIDSSGKILWGDSCAVGARSVIGLADWCVIGSSVPGQAYLAWVDMLGNHSIFGDNQVFVQRFDQHGKPMWPEPGLEATEHVNWDRRYLSLINDGSGGVFVFWSYWHDERTCIGGSAGQQEVQHFDSTGTRLIGPGGKKLFDGGKCRMGESHKDIINDGKGGFFIYFTMGPYGMYSSEVQHYDGDLTTTHWRNEKNPDHPGVEIVEYNGGYKRNPPDYAGISAALDGAGGMFIAGPGYYKSENWVQWVDGTGRPRWNGGPFFPEPADTGRLLGKSIYYNSAGLRVRTMIRATGVGEAFIVWSDDRSGTVHSYIAKVTTDGLVSVQPLSPQRDAAFALRYTYPQPAACVAHAGGDVMKAGTLSVAVYDLGGREIARVFEGWRDPGSFELPVALEGIASGAYYLRARMGMQESVIPIVVAGRR